MTHAKLTPNQSDTTSAQPVRERTPIDHVLERLAPPLSQIAIKRLLYPGASVARFLAVSTSLVNRMANMEAVDLDSYIESSL